MPSSKTSTAAPKSNSKVTREQLDQAAQMRSQGATWNAIREATGSKLGSSGWFRAWEREGIEHAPAGEKPKPAASGASELTEKPASTPKATGSTRRPRAKAKPQNGPKKATTTKPTA